MRIAIVGSGFAGLGMAAKLMQAGVGDFAILERASDLGGTWRDNTYPGCQCDVPSHLYSFSFAPNPDWSRTYSLQTEIQDYLHRVAAERGLDAHIHYCCDVRNARWDQRTAAWQLETSRGALSAELLVAAVGGLSEPRTPQLPGLETFPGAVFHSAAWDHAHDLGGERVAVVGTGSSAIQLVPQIQPRVARLHLFQRTAPWVLPHPDRPITRIERRLFRASPALQRALRGFAYALREAIVLGLVVDRRLVKLLEARARRHLRRQVPDPELRAKLEPQFTLGCKRILLSDAYYPALTQPNVELLATGIAEVRGSTVVGGDSSERDVDAIVFGTGFETTQLPIAERVRGRGGPSLADRWRGGMEAYLGATIDGFPNFFMLHGPNTGTGWTSMVYMLESQIAHVLAALRTLERHGARTIEPTPAAVRGFADEIERRMAGTVWTAGGCQSWYIDARNGRNTTLWPDFSFRFRRRAVDFDERAYALDGAGIGAAPAAKVGPAGA